MVSTPYPWYLRLHHPDGGNQGIAFSVDLDGYARELFLYEIPRGMEIIGLECATIDRGPEDQSQRYATIHQFNFLLWKPVDHFAPYNKIKSDFASPARIKVDKKDKNYYY